MKTKILIAASLLLMMVPILTACGQDVYPFDPNNEPPIPNELEQYQYLYDMPVPDFLDDEQQQLYRRAYAFYQIFRSNCADLTSVFPLEDGTFEYTSGRIEDGVNCHYFASNGRYKTWKNFESAVLSVFTKTWLDQQLSVEPVPFYNSHGEVMCLDVSMGYDISYKGMETNTFELIEKTEDKISFQLIEHYTDYSPTLPQFNLEPPLETGLQLGDDYSLAREMILVRTDSGWKFSAFQYRL